MINAFVRRVVLLLFLSGCALNVGVASELPITVWKSPTCGCCQAWVDYLEDNGFSVIQSGFNFVCSVALVSYKMP